MKTLTTIKTLAMLLCLKSITNLKLINSLNQGKTYKKKSRHYPGEVTYTKTVNDKEVETQTTVDEIIDIYRGLWRLK